MNKSEKNKTVDVVVWALLTIGGLNWGLVGFFNVDLVAAVFGEMSILSRLVYALVGLSAIYEITQFRAITKRWHLQFHSPATA